LKAAGKGCKPHAADALTEEDIQTLFEKGQIGLDHPIPLTNGLWYMFMMYFGMRGTTEMRSLCWGDVALKTDGTREYLE
jgi:hypothetical protein